MSGRRTNQNRSFFTWLKPWNTTDTGVLEKGSAADPGVCTDMLVRYVGQWNQSYATLRMEQNRRTRLARMAGGASRNINNGQSATHGEQ